MSQVDIWCFAYIAKQGKLRLGFVKITGFSGEWVVTHISRFKNALIVDQKTNLVG